MINALTYADVLRPSQKVRGLVYDAILVLTGSLLLALSAQVAVNLPFSPVPVTAQTLVVLLLGALLGSKRAVATVLLYLAEGFAGLPVFSQGKATLAVMVGPTGGYLFGFVIAAYVVGFLAENKWDRRVSTTIMAMLIGNLIIYYFGALWLTFMIGPTAALVTGVLAFIPGDIIKIAIAAVLLPAGWKIINRNSPKSDKSSFLR